MSQAMQQDLRRRTEQLLEGPLKHVKAAALAAALLPLASVAATPASAQTLCPSGGVCGIVFDDENKNGVQDVGEAGIPEVKVVICQLCDGIGHDRGLHRTRRHLFGVRADQVRQR